MLLCKAPTIIFRMSAFGMGYFIILKKMGFLGWALFLTPPPPITLVLIPGNLSKV